MSTFNELLAAHLDALPNGFVAAVEAERFRDSLRASHPEVLAAWLAEHELEMIRQAITGLDRRNRTLSRTRGAARQFGDAGDDPERLSVFDIRFVVDGENLRKRVADMTGADHRFVADSYDSSATQAAMLAQFHRAIAKKVGKRRTADVLDAGQYESLLKSITGSVEIGHAA